MRILVTNDDGIHGPGLVTMENIARSISDDVWVVAPDVGDYDSAQLIGRYQRAVRVLDADGGQHITLALEYRDLLLKTDANRLVELPA